MFIGHTTPNLHIHVSVNAIAVSQWEITELINKQLKVEILHTGKKC